MDTKSITAVIIGLMVSGLILVAFVPVFTEVTATEKTFINDGYFYVEKISADDDREITITWDATEPKQFTIDDTVVDVTDWPGSGYTIATDGDSKIVRMGTSPAVALQTMGADFGSGGSGVKTSEITISQGTITVITVNSSDVSATRTATYTDLWVYSVTPTDLVMKKADKIAYLNEDSDYLAMGVTTVTQWNTIIQVIGTVDDFDAEIVFPSGVTTTVTNKDVVVTKDTTYKNLYELDKLTFTVNDGTTTVNAVYSYFIVPSEVTSELSVHGDDTFNAIINIIPLLAGVGLLMAGVYYFISRK